MTAAQDRARDLLAVSLIDVPAEAACALLVEYRDVLRQILAAADPEVLARQAAAFAVLTDYKAFSDAGGPTEDGRVLTWAYGLTGSPACSRCS